uniref:hypothetical protein n=1 Tax=Endozoicomonas sp. ONNA1 TaxID=2828740 RepID=UPI0021489F8C
MKPTPSSESEQVIEADVEIVKPSIAENMLKNASATLLPHLEKGDTQAVGKWVSELLEKAKGKTSTRVENQGIRRIIVANSAKDRPYTEEVIKRARKINPEIDVIFAGSRDDKDCLKFPPQLNPHGK